MEIVSYADSYKQAFDRFVKLAFVENHISLDYNGRHGDLKHPEQYECFFVLKSHANILGSVALRPLKENGICEMKRLYLLKEAQGLGWGSKLFDTVIEHARRFGYTKIRLDTKEQFNQAIRLIESRGFYRIPRYNESSATRFYEKLL